jgi:hypothetical protein
MVAHPLKTIWAFYSEVGTALRKIYAPLSFG